MRTGSFLNEMTFTGSVMDASTGLQYMNARFYNPRTGRFLTQDTYSGNPYDPWTQHLYAYCGNNPTSFTDPTGHYFAPVSDDDTQEYKDRVMALYRKQIVYAKMKKVLNKGSGVKGSGIFLEQMNNLSICVDGSPTATKNIGVAEEKDIIYDGKYQNTTSYSKNNQYLDGMTINYWVFPKNYEERGNTAMNLFRVGQASDGAIIHPKGDFAVIIDTVTWCYAGMLVGEAGPDNQFNEISYAALDDLGVSENAIYRGDDGVKRLQFHSSFAGDGRYQIIYFPNTTEGWNSIPKQTEIDAAVSKYF